MRLVSHREHKVAPLQEADFMTNSSRSKATRGHNSPGLSPITLRPATMVKHGRNDGRSIIVINKVECNIKNI